MKKALLFSLICLVSLVVQAQQSYFLYLQTEGNVPFYMKLQDKVYSSSALGYMILPELSDSTYTLSLGIPSTAAGEGRFSLSMRGNDHGYLLRAADGALQLYDLQGQGIIKPLNDASKTSLTYESRSDAFSTLLSKAAGDPSLLYVPVAVKKEIKADDKKAVVSVPPNDARPVKDETPNQKGTEKDSVKTETGTALTEPPVKEAAKTDTLTAYVPVRKDTTTLVLAEPKKEPTDNAGKPAGPDSTAVVKEEKKPLVKEPEAGAADEVYARTQVRKYSESSTSEGFGLVYIDKGASPDTIRLLIPNPKITFAEEPAVAEAPKKAAGEEGVNKEKVTENKTVQTEDTKPEEKKPAAKKDEVPRQDTLEKAPLKPEEATSSDTLVQSPIKVTAGPLIKPVRPKCGNQATEKDFFKLRSAMAQRNSDEEMVETAKKVFKSRCFSTEQIR
ncbi:MAG TPA: hypothetical protein VHK91_02830, partial [Flavisolibacter sp.]|nr:hypothetical protein [Flavisolibacter sp.]